MRSWRIDQSGFGSRLSETGPFYRSLSAVVAHGAAGRGRAFRSRSAAKRRAWSIRNEIYLFGFSLGGTVAIYAAALDSRVKGIVAVAGFTPMRTDTAATGTGGVARLRNERDS